MSSSRLPVPAKVNSLTPIRFVSQTTEARAHWICLCDCGKECIKRGPELAKGRAKSCGCEKYEAVASALSKALTKHGQSGYSETIEYRTWKAIRNRCSNPNDPHYPQYGGRGIKVCERWQTFENFFADMGKRPRSKTSIDRVDVNKDYGPDNCEWADSHQQARHRTDNVLITWRGKIQCLSDWANEIGLGKKTIQRSLDAGWSVERALTEPRVASAIKAWETRREKAS